LAASDIPGLAPLIAEYDGNGDLVAKYHHDGGLIAMTRGIYLMSELQSTGMSDAYHLVGGMSMKHSSLMKVMDLGLQGIASV